MGTFLQDGVLPPTKVDDQGQSARLAALDAKYKFSAEEWNQLLGAVGDLHTGLVDGTAPVLAAGSTARRSLAEHLGDALGLANFGTATSGADATATLQAAAASGKRVKLPRGTFLCTDTLTFTAGSVLFAEDPASTVLQFSSGTPGAPYVALRMNGDDTGIEGVTINITGGRYERGVDFRGHRSFMRRCVYAFASPDIPGGSYHAPIRVAAGFEQRDVRIEDNDITVLGGYNVADVIIASDAPGLQVLRNYIHDIDTSRPGGGIWAVYAGTNCPHSLVAYNRFVNLGLLGGVHHNEPSDPAVWGVNYGRSVVGNVINGSDAVGISIDYAVGGLIEGNHVIDVDIPITLAGMTRNARIVGNHVELVRDDGSPGDVNRPMIVVPSGATGTLVANNTLGARGAALTGFSINGPDTVLADNLVVSEDPPGRAILVAATAVRSRILGNTVQGNDAHTGSSLQCVAPDVDIRGNRINVGAGAGAYGIQASGNNSEVSDNRVVGGTGNGIWISGGTGSVVRDNIIANGLAKQADTIARDNIIAGKPSRAVGTGTFNGDGSRTTFDMPHGLYTTPTAATVTPGSTGATGAFICTPNGTNVRVVFTVAPPAGTSNVVLNWVAEVS